MKNLNMLALFLCVYMLLPFALNAQTTPEDSAAYKMSHEKADSLLISLLKEKSRGEKISFEAVSNSDSLVEVAPVHDMPIIDTLTNENVPDIVEAKDEIEIRDSVPVAESLSADSPVNAGVTQINTAEKNRKKAKISRAGLLTEKESGYYMLKTEDGVDYKDLHSINESTTLGMGGYRMKDEYLSPEKYGGLGFRFMNERMRLMKSNDKISRQNIINVDISSTINGAESANFLSAFVDYSLGYHYRFFPDPYLKILVGGSTRGMLGMVYNTRNVNNPMTIHADIDLNLSLAAIYEFRVKNHPLAIRYQFETPFMGFLFSPIYNQSYYEIFSLGNTAEVIKISSFHNKFAMRNHLTLDIPVGSMTARVGYFGQFYSTNIHEIERYIISHNFTLGFVKEFVAFGAREIRKRSLFRSAYY